MLLSNKFWRGGYWANGIFIFSEHLIEHLGYSPILFDLIFCPVMIQFSPLPLVLVAIRKTSCCVLTPSITACLFLKASDFTATCLWLAHVNYQTTDLMNYCIFIFFGIKCKHPKYEPHSNVQDTLLHHLLSGNVTVIAVFSISVLPVSETAPPSQGEETFRAPFLPRWTLKVPILFLFF